VKPSGTWRANLAFDPAKRSSFYDGCELRACLDAVAIVTVVQAKGGAPQGRKQNPVSG
jgi:hypothetical protein